MNLPRLSAKENEWFMRELYPHQSVLNAWLRSRYPTIPHIDDIIQDSYLRVLKINRETKLKAPKAYLFSTARNICIDFLRKEKIVKFQNLSDMSDDIFPENDLGVQEGIIRKEEFQILAEAIKKLPKKCRRVFTLRKVYGLSVQQISEELKISTRTVENQLFIGVRKCRDHYASVDRELEFNSIKQAG